MLCGNHKVNLLLTGGAILIVAVAIVISTVRRIAMLSENKGNAKYIMPNLFLSFRGIDPRAFDYFVLPVDDADRSMFATERQRFYIRLPVFLVATWLCVIAYDAACTAQ